MARRVGRSFHRGPRRAMDWGASAPLTGYVAVAASSAVLLQTFTPILGGETVIRTRGVVSIQSDQIVATEVQLGAYGIAIVTAQAVSVGITAIPHPVTDAAWGGWFFHTYFANSMKFGTAVGIQYDRATNFEIDSKAMRKVDEDERLVAVVENSSGAGMEIWDSFRLLSKVH